MAADPYRYFRIEAAELHAELGQGVLDLERGPRDADLVPRLLRLAHTLKGAARVVKQREIADGAHALEEILGAYRETTMPVEKGPIEALLRLLDGIGGQVAVLAAPRPKEAPMDVPPQSAPAPSTGVAIDDGHRRVRANVAEMDSLLEGIGEAHILVGAVRRSRSSLEQARRLVDLLVEQLSSPRSRESLRGGAALVTARTHSLATQLQGVIAGVEQGLASGIDQLDQELRQVRDAAEHMRLVPASSLFMALERAARDVAQAQGKSVVFEGRGGDVRLDAPVLDAVQGALAQVVRNAVAHGVELPAERRAAGKPADARVVIAVVRRGRRAVFTCTDDGRGIDLDAVRSAAERKGLLTGEGRELGTAQLLDLLLRGRISTSAAVTEISGRGIGLDILREATDRLGGEAAVRTVRGQGTTVELIAPLSLASLQALLVEAAGAAIAIPLDAVRETLRVASRDLARTSGGQSLAHDGEVIPFAVLSKIMGGTAPVDVPVWSAVIVEGESGRAAIAVDRLLGTSTVIQRPLPDLAPTTAVVAGVSIDPSGNPQLVLDPDGLVAAARDSGLAPPLPVTRPRRVLVIDDSMTTRMLEQSILESAGYDVEVADCAEDGLAKARAEVFGLVLVDVEMPGMDGFSFIAQARTEPTLRDVPCILVTSRDAPEDRERGHAVGANGYIVKGEFDQNALLAQIRRLVR